jgi:hypothetical protein
MKIHVFKMFVFIIALVISSGLTFNENNATANDLTDANTSALTDDLGIGNPLCRGQLYKNCHSSTGSCSFNISPSVVCTISGFKPGINPG